MALESCGDPWKDLANAIVFSGIKDYKRALVHLKRDPESKAAARGVQEGKRFLSSDWFAMLTDVDPEYLDRKLNELIDEKE